jgi:hypothetical protein
LKEKGQQHENAYPFAGGGRLGNDVARARHGG